MRIQRRSGREWLTIALVALAACSTADAPTGLTDVEAPTPSDNSSECSIPIDEIVNGGPGKDGIPALTNPSMVAPGVPGTEYLRPADRVIGFHLDGQAFAVPHNVGWYHEIVNFDHGGHQVAITYCPLTGSSLAFDRGPLGGVTFGVSGLLYRNNLIMYDRSDRESLWPQMSRGARCGPKTGTGLRTIPVYEMTWEGWVDLYPSTLVVSRPHEALYQTYPYGDYESRETGTIFAQELDVRRGPKERVLGIPLGQTSGIAFPLPSLAAAGERLAMNIPIQGKDLVVLWDGTRQAAAAHEGIVGGRTLSIEVVGERFIDRETGSEWTVDGRAINGPLAGERLRSVPEAYVAFWFAWAAFHPETQLWGPILKPTR